MWKTIPSLLDPGTKGERRVNETGQVSDFSRFYKATNSPFFLNLYA